MTDRKWNNQGGSNRDGFNFKKFKPRRQQVVPPFEDLKESLVTSFLILKPRRPKPNYGEFGDAIWNYELIDDDLEIKEPAIKEPTTKEPSEDIREPFISDRNPENESINIFPYAIEDEYEIVVKYSNKSNPNNPSKIVLIISSGQAYAARNKINDPRFDLAIVVKSNIPISFASVASTVNVISLVNSPQNPIYSLYNWVLTKLILATDFTATMPDLVLEGLQFRPNTLQLPITNFTTGSDTYSLFYSDNIQPEQICLNAVNKVLYFQPTANSDNERLWWVTYAGAVLPLCLNLVPEPEPEPEPEPIVPIVSINFTLVSLQTIEAGSGNVFIIRISIDVAQTVSLRVKLQLSGDANPLFYITSGIDTDINGNRFTSIPQLSNFVDVTIEPLEDPSEIEIRSVRLSTIDDTIYDLDANALFAQGVITPRIIAQILYRYLFLFVNNGNLRLGGYNDVNSVTNLIPIPDDNPAYDSFAPNSKIFYGLNTIEPSSNDWSDLIPYKDSAIDPSGYTEMYWRFTWIEFDINSNSAIVKYRKKDNAIVQTPQIENIDSRFPRWCGSNTWVCKITNGSLGDSTQRFLFEYLEDFYFFRTKFDEVIASDTQPSAFARLRQVPSANTKFGYQVRQTFLYDSIYDVRYISNEKQFVSPAPFDNLNDAVVAFEPIIQTRVRLQSQFANLNTFDNSAVVIQLLKINGTVASELTSNIIANIPTVISVVSSQGIIKYDLTVSLGNDLIIRAAADISNQGPQQSRFDRELFSTGYSKRILIVASQLNLVNTETLVFNETRKNDTAQNNALFDTTFRYYNRPLFKNFSIEPIGQPVKLTNTHLDFNIPAINNNVGDLVVNFTPASFVFKKKYVSELVRTLVCTPDGGRTRITVLNKYTYSATPLWDYLNNSALGFFTIITNSNITNVRSVSVNSSEVSTLQTNYEQQRYNMSLNPNDPVFINNSQFIQTESNQFFGLDFNTNFRVNTQIDAIFYNNISTYAHNIPDLLAPNRVRIVFVGDGYFTPQDTIVTKSRPSETGIAARIYKSRKSSANTGIVENWAVTTDGRIELQSIVKSPVGIFNGAVVNSSFYPGIP